MTLPSGTFTFLLTEIEGSTRLWQRAAETMSAAGPDSYAILDEASAAHDGTRPVEQGEAGIAEVDSGELLSWRPLRP